MAVIFMFQVLSVKSTMIQAMYQTARDVTGYAYVLDSKAQSSQTNNKQQNGRAEVFEKDEKIDAIISYTYIWVKLTGCLNDNFVKSAHIVGGKAGITVVESEILKQGNEIKICISYMIKNPFDLFGIVLLPVRQSVTAAAWLGEDYRDMASSGENEEIVYITENGSVYHRDRKCKYLDMTVNAVMYDAIGQLRNAAGAKYYPCETCGRLEHGSQVYITKYGNRYHTSSLCSKLKRTVIAIPISKVGNRHACSKCGG